MHAMSGATPYRVSTITATGSINTDINLDLLFEELCFTIENQGVGKTLDNITGFVYAEFGKTKSVTYYTGIAKKYIGKQVPKHTSQTHVKSKRFDNQLTIIYKYDNESLINIKVFKNGNIQMTGVKQCENGSSMIDILIDTIKTTMQNKTVPIVTSVETLANTNYKIALINSDFKVNFEVKRDKLHTVLKQQYGVRCSFEPCIYPGVKIQYFWNKTQNFKNGLCKCSLPCIHGKGDGNGDMDCKKITIAVFQSGCVIITGAQTTQQIDDAYDFICHILFKHKEHVEKTVIATATTSLPPTPKPKIMLRKDKIVYHTQT